jgi:hypothetical protein
MLQALPLDASRHAADDDGWLATCTIVLHILARAQTASQKDQVWISQAERYFDQKSYLLAAQYYGKTTRSFEEISLKFIRLKYGVCCL